MGTKRPRPVVLDASALIAVDRADRRVIRLLELALEIHVPAATRPCGSNGTGTHARGPIPARPARGARLLR